MFHFEPERDCFEELVAIAPDNLLDVAAQEFIDEPAASTLGIGFAYGHDFAEEAGPGIAAGDPHRSTLGEQSRGEEMSML
jgi:hypothetical protein